MKKYLTPAAIGLVLLSLGSCKKDANTTATPSVNNNTTVTTTHLPAYTIDGLTDVEFSEAGQSALMPLTFTYHDSAQQTVTVNVSGLPSFITMYKTQMGTLYSNNIPAPWTFTPTYSMNLVIQTNYTAATYVPGTYKITLTCVGTLSGTKTISFNIICY